jgi:hypothetical protein
MPSIPFQERVTLDEPFRGPFVVRFAGNMVVLPRIRGRKPLLNIIPQLIAYPDDLSASYK